MDGRGADPVQLFGQSGHFAHDDQSGRLYGGGASGYTDYPTLDATPA